MQELIRLKPEFTSLKQIEDFVNNETKYTATQEYDAWDVRTDENGQMDKCVIIKKNSMNGVKVYFSDKNTLKADFKIPNKLAEAFLGKSQQEYKGIKEIVGDAINNLLLSSSQQKAFDEIIDSLEKITI